MTCNDCIHYDVCGRWDNWNDEFYTDGNSDRCYDYSRFKDKSRFIELPNVEIGQELFYVDRYTKTVESDVVSILNWEKTDLGVQTGIWSENNGFSEFFSDIGKTLFLTKEEAEAELKELNENEMSI